MGVDGRDGDKAQGARSGLAEKRSLFFRMALFMVNLTAVKEKSQVALCD